MSNNFEVSVLRSLTVEYLIFVVAKDKDRLQAGDLCSVSKGEGAP